jgi:hypothetical protein
MPAIDSFMASRRRVLALKLEATPGTAEALSDSDTGIDARDVVLTPSVEKEEVPGNGTVDSQKSQVGQKTASISFTTYLRNSALVRTALRACGLAMTGTGPYTFTPVTLAGSDFGETATIAVYEAGYRRMLVGAMGDFTISASGGRVPVISFNFQAKYPVEADVTYPTPAIETPSRGTIWAGYSTTLDSTQLRLSRFSFSAGNQLYLRPDETSTEGILTTLISGRAPSVSLDPEAVLVATKAWYTKLIASDTMALAIPIGDTVTPAANSIAIAASAAELMDKQRGDRGEVMTDEMSLMLRGTPPYTIVLN